MRLQVDFSGLASLVRRMGARAIQWDSASTRLAEIDIQDILLKGQEIELAEVEVTSDGLLTYKGEQVLLYIKDTMKDQYTLENEPEKGPKFHVADCRTLEDMRSKKRFQRYVVTNNTSGIFDVEYTDQYTKQSGETASRLKVCRNCLQSLNYKFYGDKDKGYKDGIVEEFSINEFFEKYSSHFKSKPKYSDQTAPKAGYSKDWAGVSQDYRTSVGWICENCSVDLSETGFKKLLHTHHMNGVKGDNRPENLKALCLLCHSEEPHHNHMHIKPTDKAKILKARMQKKDNKKKEDREAVFTTISPEQARTELIQLRNRIVKEHPNADRSAGILRKNMMKHFLDDRIATKSALESKVPKHEIRKTDQSQMAYLEDIFIIIRKIR